MSRCNPFISPSYLQHSENLWLTAFMASLHFSTSLSPLPLSCAWKCLEKHVFYQHSMTAPLITPGWWAQPRIWTCSAVHVFFLPTSSKWVFIMFFSRSVETCRSLFLHAECSEVHWAAQIRARCVDGGLQSESGSVSSCERPRGLVPRQASTLRSNTVCCRQQQLPF